MSIGDVFTKAWELWRRDVGWLILAGLVVGLIVGVVAVIVFVHRRRHAGGQRRGHALRSAPASRTTTPG